MTQPARTPSIGLVDTSRSPHARLRPAQWNAVRWTGGFMHELAERCARVMVPAMGRLMTETERVRYLGNFLVAAGAEEGRHRGPRWNDGDFYKWLEAACSVLGVSNDPLLEAQIDSIIAAIARAQRPDGYIHTDIQIRRAAGEAIAPFDNAMDFEMYNMGHLMTAACVHHRVTGKHSLLKLAVASAEFLAQAFASPTPALARHGICPSHLMGLVELHRTTGAKSHLDLSIALLAMRDRVEKGDDDNQDRVAFNQQTTAHGHAVRATYLYAGVADIIAETGDATLLKTLQTIWSNLVERKLYITGGCGALFDGASPDGADDQANITRVHQAFGREYQLPQATAHNETCAAIGNLMWNWRMFLLTGELRFADLVEHTFFNSVLAGVGLDGVSFFYTNTLRQTEPMPVPLRWNQMRQQFMSCFCCPPNVVRMIAQIQHYACGIAEREVRVVWYGTGRFDLAMPDGSALVLRQKSDYPWSGSIRITIERSDATHATRLLLRIPAWCEAASARVNGKSLAAPAAGKFLAISRRWRAGDTIDLELDMPARLVEAHPLVEESRQQAAVVRGPVVYCLESADLPKGTKVLDVALQADAPIDVSNADKKLGVVLETSAITRTGKPSGAGLYRKLGSGAAALKVRFVPYFVWGNRGAGEMSVWLPWVPGTAKPSVNKSHGAKKLKRTKRKPR